MFFTTQFGPVGLTVRLCPAPTRSQSQSLASQPASQAALGRQQGSNPNSTIVFPGGSQLGCCWWPPLPLGVQVAGGLELDPLAGQQQQGKGKGRAEEAEEEETSKVGSSSSLGGCWWLPLPLPLGVLVVGELELEPLRQQQQAKRKAKETKEVKEVVTSKVDGRP